MLKNVTHKDSLLNSEQFTWFTGVVENIMDPKELGRIQVRCIGYHTEDKKYIPSFTLPWATIAQPAGMSAFSAFGLSTTGIQQGTWVVGFFRDGQNAQDPVIIGALPGNIVIPDYNYGFSDPFKQFPLTDSQLTKDGTPISIRNTLDQPREATSKYKDTFSFEEKNTIYNELDFSFSDGIRDVKTYGRSILHTNNPIYPNNIVSSTRPKIARSGFDSIELEKVDGVHTDVIKKKLYLDDNKKDNRKLESRFIQHVSENDFTKDFERKTDIHPTGTLREWNHLGEEYKNVVGSKNQRVGNDKIDIVLENSIKIVGRNKTENIEGNITEITKGSSRVSKNTAFDTALSKRNITSGGFITERQNGYNLENTDWEITKNKDVSAETNYLSQRCTGGTRTHLGNSDVKLNLGRKVENVNVTDLNRVKKHRHEFVGKLGRGGSSQQGSASEITIAGLDFSMEVTPEFGTDYPLIEGNEKKQQLSKGYGSDVKEFYKGFQDTLVWGTREENVRLDVTQWYELNQNHSVVGAYHSKIMGHDVPGDIAKRENVYNKTKYEYHSEVVEFHQRDYYLHIGKELDETIFDEYPFLDEDRRFCERPGVPLAKGIAPTGNRYTVIELDDELEVRKNKYTTVFENEELVVKKDRIDIIEGDDTLTVLGKKETTVSGTNTLESNTRTIIDGYGYPRSGPRPNGTILYLLNGNWTELNPPVSSPAVLGWMGGPTPVWVTVENVLTADPTKGMTVIPAV